ncbi:hypothetical protein [Streptomyces sp. PSAA01]|nr:hypothetical protein [Streptomyces sp. PSAA01]
MTHRRISKAEAAAFSRAFKRVTGRPPGVGRDIPRARAADEAG